MAESLRERFKSAWNAFSEKNQNAQYHGESFSYRPDRTRFRYGSERTIIASVYNRIALDVASIDIRHVNLDADGRFESLRDSGLNRCLSLSANIDQTGRAFVQDCVLSLFDEGVIAIVPIDTNVDPGSRVPTEIYSMRVGKVVEWYPRKVKLLVYNDRTGHREEIVMDKRSVAIIENPLYSVINQPNSTVQRLIRKLSLLDAVDEYSSSGKLDLIIQLPYSAKSELRKKQAEDRRADLERQLTGSRYGVAYIDGTEHVTQLNRPVENNLMAQIKYLTDLAFSQIGITTTILDGTADEQTMLNYYNRSIEPIVAALADGMKRCFLTQTAITQGQSIEYYRDPFRLVPVGQIAEIGDKFTRNEIMSSNEIRQIVGLKPSLDPKADQLRNSNLNHPDEGADHSAINKEDNNQNEETEEAV